MSVLSSATSATLSIGCSSYRRDLFACDKQIDQRAKGLNQVVGQIKSVLFARMK